MMPLRLQILLVRIRCWLTEANTLALEAMMLGAGI